MKLPWLVSSHFAHIPAHPSTKKGQKGEILPQQVTLHLFHWMLPTKAPAFYVTIRFGGYKMRVCLCDMLWSHFKMLQLDFHLNIRKKQTRPHHFYTFATATPWWKSRQLGPEVQITLGAFLYKKKFLILYKINLGIIIDGRLK